MSGTGKSSALAELARRGFRTVDTDEPGWTVEDTDGGRWWDEEPIAQLLADEGPTLSYRERSRIRVGSTTDSTRSCSSALRPKSSSNGSRRGRRTTTARPARSKS